MARGSLSGDMGTPLIILHGALDALLPITTNSDEYAKLVDKVGKSDLRCYYYTIEAATT
jgi:hypothetical protein